MARLLITGGLAAAGLGLLAAHAAGAGISVQSQQVSGQPAKVTITATGNGSETAVAYARPADQGKCEATAAAFRAATPGAIVLLPQTTVTGEPVTVTYSPTAAGTVRICAYVEGGSGSSTSLARSEVVITVAAVPPDPEAAPPAADPEVVAGRIEEIVSRLDAVLRDVGVRLRERSALLRWRCPAPAAGDLGAPLVVVVRAERGLLRPATLRSPAVRATLTGSCADPAATVLAAKGARTTLGTAADGLLVRHPRAAGRYLILVSQGGRVVYRLRYAVTRAKSGWTAVGEQTLATIRG